ncbi:TPA: hypothetical protein I8W54_002112 [Morganella morganii]|nr:hypothetical protein [Morganella morganii]HAT1528356.1 hypothetical protein [Morganella morganii]
MTGLGKVRTGIGVILVISLLLTLHLYSGLKDNHQALKDKHVALTAVNNITLSAVAINHRISLDNIKAKQTEGTEHVNVKTVIKTVFKDSECAVALVPVDVVSELRKYADGIRSRSGGADSATTDRGL